MIAAAGATLIGGSLAVPSGLFAHGATPPAAAPTELGVLPLNPCSRPRLHLRCPNLVMSAPAELHVDQTTRPGRILLRATSSVSNLGAGPIELRGHRGSRRRWVVYQAIYDRHGHRRLFRTHVRLVFKYIPGDRYEQGYLGSASYWKVRHLAAFQLWSVDSDRHLKRLVRTGPKVDYCMRDLERTHPSRRSPPNAVYPACSEEPRLSHHRFGISIGWSDVYPYSYPEQWIDVTGLHGIFAFVQLVNPNGLWLESNTQDNASMVFVALPSGRSLGQRVGVPIPTGAGPLPAVG